MKQFILISLVTFCSINSTQAQKNLSFNLFLFPFDHTSKIHNLKEDDRSGSYVELFDSLSRKFYGAGINYNFSNKISIGFEWDFIKSNRASGDLPYSGWSSPEYKYVHLSQNSANRFGLNLWFEPNDRDRILTLRPGFLFHYTHIKKASFFDLINGYDRIDYTSFENRLNLGVQADLQLKIFKGIKIFHRISAGSQYEMYKIDDKSIFPEEITFKKDNLIWKANPLQNSGIRYQF